MTPVSRRRFLLAAVTFSGIAASPAMLRMSAVWAQSDQAPGGAMINMARLLIPYESIGDEVYAQILDNTLTAFGDSMPRSLVEAELALNDEAAGNFLAADEQIQLDALQAIQGEEFFATILNALKTLFYNHPDAWAVMGYEGPSWQKGGYLNRGAGEIDWLPEND